MLTGLRLSTSNFPREQELFADKHPFLASEKIIVINVSVPLHFKRCSWYRYLHGSANFIYCFVTKISWNLEAEKSSLSVHVSGGNNSDLILCSLNNLEKCLI